jgi:hypothetical protein
MVTPLPRSRTVLTGKVRGRPRLFSRKLVLQVEIAIQSAPWSSTFIFAPLPGCKDPEAWLARQRQKAQDAWKTDRVEWRDATWQDELELNSRWSPL